MTSNGYDIRVPCPFLRTRHCCLLCPEVSGNEHCQRSPHMSSSWKLQAAWLLKPYVTFVHLRLLLKNGALCRVTHGGSMCIRVSLHAGLLQADAIASLAGQGPTVGNQLAALAAEHGQLSAHLAEAEAAEKKLDVLAQLQQRLADFDVLLSSGVHAHPAFFLTPP